jgi:adenylate cyclase
MQRSIVIKRPNGASDTVVLTGSLTQIGRSEENDVVLDDPTRKVSRQHAQIVCEAAGQPSAIVDLKSVNGVLLNGEPVPGRANLRAGDILTVGLYRLVYHEEADASSQPKPITEVPLPFQIEAAPVHLEQLQNNSRLLELAADGAPMAASAVDLSALELMHEVSVSLARTVTVRDVTETAIDLLFRITGVQRATFIPWDEDLQAFQHADVFTRSRKVIDVGRTPANYDPRQLILSRTILSKVREANSPLHIRDARSVAQASGALSIANAGIQAALCSPLSFQGRFLGVLYADNLMTPEVFSPDDFRTFTSIAAQAGMALASANARDTVLKREVELAAMRLYLPPQVADRISAEDGFLELGGVLQTVTVLFADIRGFTPLTEQMAAPEVVLMLNEFFTAMTEAIQEAGGTLDKYIGDCVMALFGAPVVSPDDAQRGIRAAIGMQREVLRLNVARRSRGLCDISIGVGLHTGPAVIGNIGSAQRMQYTAIGDTVNVAARVVSTAKAGQVLASESVRAAVEDDTAFQSLGEVKLKGRQQAVNIYSVNWDGPTL